jgi:hypothetical protein
MSFLLQNHCEATPGFSSWFKWTASVKFCITEIHIQASADTVWSILTDFGSYHNWNPFIRQAKGKAISGQRLENRPEVSGGRGVVFRPVVTYPGTGLS